MMEGSLSIVRLFCRDLSRELTIRQISKLIRKSYAYTNKEAWELIGKGVLSKKEIGKSVVCSLNIKSGLAVSLLTFNSSIEKKGFSVSGDILKAIKENSALTAFFSKNKLFVVCSDKSLFKGLKANLMTKDDFLAAAKKSLDNTPVYGFEKYWEMVGDAYE